MSTHLVQLVIVELRRRGKQLGRVRLSDAERIASTIVRCRVDDGAAAWFYSMPPDHAWNEFRRAWRERVKE